VKEFMANAICGRTHRSAPTRVGRERQGIFFCSRSQVALGNGCTWERIIDPNLDWVTLGGEDSCADFYKAKLCAPYGSQTQLGNQSKRRGGMRFAFPPYGPTALRVGARALTKKPLTPSLRKLYEATGSSGFSAASAGSAGGGVSGAGGGGAEDFLAQPARIFSRITAMAR